MLDLSAVGVFSSSTMLGVASLMISSTRKMRPDRGSSLPARFPAMLLPCARGRRAGGCAARAEGRWVRRAGESAALAEGVRLKGESAAQLKGESALCVRRSAAAGAPRRWTRRAPGRATST